jgi:hypothetical protein
MTLSFNKLNEIAAIYESIADSEQEQLDEDLNDRIKQGLTSQAMANSFKKSGGFNSPGFKKLGNSSGLENSIKQGLTRQAMANAYNKKPDAAAKPAPTPAAKPAPVSAKPTATAASPKVVPTKPAASKPSMGTTAGGTKFERRSATSAELKAAQDARAAAKASGNTKGAEEAAVKAGVAAGKSTLKQSFEYDAYDLVLEYLLSQGHAETVAEAQYLMTEMDAEMVGDIVEGSISSRASNAVGHQRAGTLGDDDEIRKNQDATSVSIGKMKRGSGAKVTPTLPGV